MAKAGPSLVLDPATIDFVSGAGAYPDQYKPLVPGRAKKVIGDSLGLKNYGVNIVKLEPGGCSSVRHWHTRQDEFIYVIEGEITVVNDDGEFIMSAGMVAGFPGGAENGHHMFNRAEKDAIFMEVGDRLPGDSVDFSDVDLLSRQLKAGWQFTNRKGKPF